MIYPVGTLLWQIAGSPTPVPEGWLEADGQAFDPSEYPELAKVFPNHHLPDSRARVVNPSLPPLFQRPVFISSDGKAGTDRYIVLARPQKVGRAISRRLGGSCRERRYKTRRNLARLILRLLGREPKP